MRRAIFSISLVFFCVPSVGHSEISDFRIVLDSYLGTNFTSSGEREAGAVKLTGYLEGQTFQAHENALANIEMGLAAEFYQKALQSPQGELNLLILLDVLFRRGEQTYKIAAARVPGAARIVEYSAIFVIAGGALIFFGQPVYGAIVGSGVVNVLSIVMFERGRDLSRISSARQILAQKNLRIQNAYCKKAMTLGKMAKG